MKELNLSRAVLCVSRQVLSEIGFLPLGFIISCMTDVLNVSFHVRTVLKTMKSFQFNWRNKLTVNPNSIIDDLELCVKLLKFNGGLQISTVIQTCVCKTESVFGKVKTNIGRVLSITLYTSGFYFSSYYEYATSILISFQ